MTRMILVGALVAGATLLGCGGSSPPPEGPAEKEGKEADEAAQDVKQDAKDAIDKAGDKIEEAGDKVEEKTDN